MIDIQQKAKMAGKTAIHDFLQDWNEKTGGNEYGEPMYCGFANISIHPARGPFVTWCKKNEIGSTGYGGGYRISYYDFMNGHQYNHTQSLDIKEVAMNAVSSYFKSLGITAYAESRAD